MDYGFLLDIAIILISTKLFGLITKRFHMPQVVGALLAGVILGPAVLDVLQETEFITQLSELGVIVLMFAVGLETDVKELKKTGKASFIIALFGVLIPLVGGFVVAVLFNDSTDPNKMLQNIFIGVILTATSVSITAETLKELGKLSTKAGNAILGAAIIDDILGIIALTVITSLADSSVNVWFVVLKIFGFFALSALVGFIAYKLFNAWTKDSPKDLRRFVIVAFALCLILSFVAEHFFGVADITGAFIAGLIISNTQKTKYIASRFETISYLLLSPLFFASIGIGMVLPEMNSRIILFSVILMIVAVLTKVVGCGVGAKMSGFTNRESIQIGTGMVSRGEVVLIIASKGAAVGLMNPDFFGPVIIMVILTSIVTPIFLKLVFNDKNDHSDLVESDLVNNYTELDNIALAEQRLLELDKSIIERGKKKHK